MFQFSFTLNYLINVSLIFDEQLPSFAAWFVFLLLESSTFLSAGDKIQANSMCYLLPIVKQISRIKILYKIFRYYSWYLQFIGSRSSATDNHSKYP